MGQCAGSAMMEAPAVLPTTPLPVWDTVAKTMHYVASTEGLGPKKQLRVMPWRGYIDVQRRRVYLWDIIQARGMNAVVTRWRNKLGSGYSPFGTDSRTD